ncbi:hypothetical protein DFH08DRAFT_917518 [Mycena albidolilacea]|uniref:Uncharacterized protein n=1 Tax=Mycena albidolilacea TaxID=1033008 RepID=A0AAD7EFZ1_9AGAR|nr:hypothetical protein DFH08DRAFT_917518 [Mycena albidolilacea]
MLDLPAELRTYVFDLAANEDVIFSHGLPRAMAESAWFKDSMVALDPVQRIPIYFNDPARLLTLCAILDSSLAASTMISASLWWWARKMHLTQFDAKATRRMIPESLQDVLISIISHCPNLVCIIDWPMTGTAFEPIADALAPYFRSL